MQQTDTTRQQQMATIELQAVAFVLLIPPDVELAFDVSNWFIKQNWPINKPPIGVVGHVNVMNAANGKRLV